MDSPPKLSGETLIVHHIPLVHCQVSGGRQGGCGASLKRSNPFSPPENLGLSRTTSLPERDVLQREALLYNSLIQTSGGSWSSHNGGRERKGGGRGGSTASDDSSFTSSNSEDQLITAHTLPRAKPRSRNPLRHNPFLLNTEDDEDEEEEEEDADNLSGYLEDSSFHLHSDTSALDDGIASFHLHDLSFASEPFLLHSSVGGSSRESLRVVASDLSSHLEDLDILGLDSQRRHGSSGSNMSMDCGEHDWGDDEDEDHPMRCGRSSKTGSYSSSSSMQHCSCCALSQNYPQHFPEAFPEPFSECQQGYGSDSSCNSSDGVLVNFSAIYNKMNNGVPEKPPISGHTNLNSSADHSCTSSVSDPPGNQRDSTRGAFYLDLHTSPTEPPLLQQQPSCLGSTFPLIREPHLSTSSTCSCAVEHQGALDLDANCNSYHPPHSGSSGDLASCLQSQARLVVATQNYYKLVTCDLSSQSSPSPAGSSVNSCSDEHSKGSPTPTQPSEYFLFRQRADEEGMKEEDEDAEPSRRDDDGDDEEDEDAKKKKNEQAAVGDEAAPAVIEGQVYVNVSPPVGGRGVIGGGATSGSRPRSRSYDRNLDKSPSPRLGSLERMLSCPVRLSEGAAPAPPPPPRVTSFAEIARSKRRNGGTGGSPSLKAAADPFSSTYSTHSQSSVDFSPIPEQRVEVDNLSPVPFTRCYSQGSIERHLEGLRETRAKAEGGLSSSSDSRTTVVRYRKDQRPTTLPIQPFTFHHQFASKPPQPKPLLPLLTGYASGMQPRSSSGSGSDSGGPVGEDVEDASENVHRYQGTLAAAGPPPGSVRPSPLGSYSPVRLQGAPSSGTCSTCTPSPQPPHSLSCPLSAGLGLLHTPPTGKHGGGSVPVTTTPPPPSLGVKRGIVPPMLPALQGHCFHRGGLASLPALQSDTLSPLGCLDSGSVDGSKGSGARTHNVGQSAKLQHSYSDFLPDYFSLTEKPPEEFCLSPDASTSSSSCSSSHISVDLTQKRGLVKAVNTAVDLIVAHFGTSRDPDVKAKLGNSWVSPNVGHLILKYLCPALREVLQDGLKAYVLDLIIGQRRCQPWSVVEASTQLGPSTHVLHSLFSKVSQYSELTSHSMRLNAFIFGLLNLKSLEFWFSHLYTHEDIIAAHYNPWGFLPLSQGACQPLFEELLLLLQPLSLLPFDLDLLFEPHLLQKGKEHLRRKEQLCSAGQSVDQSTRSTFQLMRGWSTTVSEMVRDSSSEVKKDRAVLRREGTWPRMEGVGSRREGTGVNPRLKKEGATTESMTARPASRQTMMEVGFANLWKERGMSGQRVKGVGQESQGEGEDGHEKDMRKEKERDMAEEGRQRQERQAGWWYQLMQSSQVYIDQSTAGAKFVKTEKRKKSSERRRGQLPPTREGVVEGAESSQEGEGYRSRKSSSSSSRESAGSRGRPSWMGSPPESIVSQEKEIKPPKVAGTGAQVAAQVESPSQGQSLRWSRLFGSSVGSPSRGEGAEQRTKAPTTRPPSGWLSLDRSVLDLVAQTIGAGSGKKAEPPATPTHTQTTPPPRSTQPTEIKQVSPCEVRALCHHIATEPGQLSFNKGDTLRVLSKADPDWLLCSLGSTQGLVPIIYVTLKNMDESQDATGLGQC
ncbi:Iporin Interacting protein of Rab1 RUN and SH3 domain-containing protein 2 [Larimichthys crocea]|uniref:Iporin Interacting protein of Rab1 RUN and SH3 domain-containing protein 2 n=1 Tax=Larimichthys crocea TaxID=215358 RepID=A0A6G0IJK8_LARCR|nr:Iporin Interacting protein of Rab1 RUN and SH3 domain-containing protein 2 [Larimichthys crocea]